MANRKLISKLDKEEEDLDEFMGTNDAKLEALMDGAERYKGEVRKYDPPKENGNA